DDRSACRFGSGPNVEMFGVARPSVGPVHGSVGGIERRDVLPGPCFPGGAPRLEQRDHRFRKKIRPIITTAAKDVELLDRVTASRKGAATAEEELCLDIIGAVDCEAVRDGNRIEDSSGYRSQCLAYVL